MPGDDLADGERWIPRDGSTTVGTSANDDSRGALKARNSGKAAASDKMSLDEAKELVAEAREKGLKLRFVAAKKGGMSGERYKKYQKLTTVAQCDGARKRLMVYKSGKMETVMRTGDLWNDVQKGICQVLSPSGEVIVPKSAQLAQFQQALAAAVESDTAFCAAVEQHWAMKADMVEVPEWVALAAKQRVMIEVDGMVEPIGIKQAMRLPEWESWKAAIEKEVSGLVSAGVWEEVPRSEVPSGRAVIPSHIIFKDS